MEWLLDPQVWIALTTLTVLEIVLGVDNIIFIAILTEKLPVQNQGKARRLGLAGAMLTRILLLSCLTWIMRLTTPLFTVFALDISGRDIILISGGLFLLVKATLEIHEKLEGGTSEHQIRLHSSFYSVIIQIMLLDIVFSFDSVITAIGLANQLAIMVSAIIIAVIVMMVFINSISDFVERHPTLKMLALSFLLLIGIALIGEGFDLHIPKGYIYFAMAFSAFVEMLNMRLSRPQNEPVQLKNVRPSVKPDTLS
ncbi:TerC family protein [bacterium]|nr:TerC family protein [bacterium]